MAKADERDDFSQLQLYLQAYNYRYRRQPHNIRLDVNEVILIGRN